jgi:Domain of unknown function (DUF4365)
MRRPPAHQIDELAQRILRNAVPSTWVVNQHYNDYGKDFLVEIVDDDGELTGASFYIQLKGHQRVEFSSEGTLVKHSLESKYARYYGNKVKDLPVFLVVAEVATKRAWWLFLQEALDLQQSWRQKCSVTLDLSVSNDISKTHEFNAAVESAKKWMRLRHPEAIHEAVVAHKEKIRRANPRFDVDVSLVDDRPQFTLLPKQEVPLQLLFTGNEEVLREKISNLLDKGALVAFDAGEVRITGSKLFEDTDQDGCQLQIAVSIAATLSITAANANGDELARLSEIPGHFTGGQKELWFDGDLPHSPLSVKGGPIAPAMGGTFKISLSPHRWDGQRLLQLAYCDRLQQFFHAIPSAALLKAECQIHGNSVFTTTMRLENQPFPDPILQYMHLIGKARKVCTRLNVNPIWSIEAFDRDCQDTIQQLDAILFGAGWSKPMPNLQLRMSCKRKTFSPLLRTGEPCHHRIVSDLTYSVMGEKVDAGRIVHEFTDAVASFRDTADVSSRSRNHKEARLRQKRRSQSAFVNLFLHGTPTTVVNARLATIGDG